MPKNKNYLSLLRSFYAFVQSSLLTRILVSGPLCSSDNTCFFPSLIWSLKPPKTMIPRKRCPMRTLSFALGVWSFVFVGQRPSNSGSVNYLYLLFAFHRVIHFAQFKPMSAMFVSSLRLPPRLLFCSQGKITSPPKCTLFFLKHYAIASLTQDLRLLNTLATVFVVEG